jgi:hypothetical protein
VPQWIIHHQPRPGQNYGPGREPESVRVAWDRHLEAENSSEAEAEAEP